MIWSLKQNFSIKNLNEDPFDFIPKDKENDRTKPCNRTIPTPVWPVATYKEGRVSIIKAAECIKNKVGSIPVGNLKRYRKNLLIKAGNETQSLLL